MDRYLVTGGAGFIGSHLCEELARMGHEVRVLDDFSTGRRENLGGLPVETVAEDVRNTPRVAAAAVGVTGIFHLAALGSVPRSFDDPESTFSVNVGGTEAVLAAARAAGVRRVALASSSSVYGASGGPRRRESEAVGPLSPYAESKLAAERLCLAAREPGCFETVCLRYFNVYGPRQDPSSRYAAAIPRFITRLLEGLPPQIYGDGEQTRDFTYVADVVAGSIAAMTTAGAAGSVVNIGTGRSTSVTRLVAVIRAIVGSRVEAEHAEARPGEVRHSVADLTVVRAVLGYAPRWSLADGLRATVAWHRERRLEVTSA